MIEDYSSIEEAEDYLTAQYDDGTFSISIILVGDEVALGEGYIHHFVCCGYGEENITIAGVPYIAIFDYGH